MPQRTDGKKRGAGQVSRGLLILAALASVVVLTEPGWAKVKVRSDWDRAFDFGKTRTWGWNADGAGKVFLARTASDDPAAVQQRVESLIRDAVTAEMPRRGLEAGTGEPDLALTYYLLVTIGSSAQVMGQFLPAVAQWGLPPFTTSTTSIKVIEQGSLVLDLSSQGRVVWRGVGEAQFKLDLSPERRTALLREAVAEILKRYPPKR